jgi:putative tryptophan/tyrosine transport system substrate-binding protein
VKRRELLTLLGGGAMIAWPFAARAQQTAMPVIGFLGSGSANAFTPFLAAFRHGLDQAGYVEGRNVAIEYRWAEGRFDRLPALAADLVGCKVDLILASGGIPSARAAKDATSTIPVVFTAVSDPVGRGLIVSLARPGGNLTGFSIMAVELMPKRFELMSELVPQIRAMALLWNPTGEITEGMVKDTQEMVRAKGMQLHILQATMESEIDAAFASLDQSHAGALIVGDDPFFTGRREQIVGLASRHGIPAIYQFRDFAVSGGLMSYGVSLTSAYRQAAMLAGKILKGAKPADLPVEQPAILELVINLKTAQVLGLTVPQSLLARADEVIE